MASQRKRPGEPNLRASALQLASWLACLLQCPRVTQLVRSLARSLALSANHASYLLDAYNGQTNIGWLIARLRL